MNVRKTFYGRIEDQTQENKKEKNYIHFENKLLQTVTEQIDHLLNLQQGNVSQIYNNRTNGRNQHVSNVHIQRESKMN